MSQREEVIIISAAPSPPQLTGESMQRWQETLDLLGRVDLTHENKTRLRELLRLDELDASIALAREAQALAAQQGYRLVTTMPRERSPFSQVIGRNTHFLVANDVLTPAECKFLLGIQNMIQIESNALVVQEGETSRPATIADVAKHLQRKSDATLRRLFAELKGKYVLGCSTTGRGNHARKVWYVNPHIFFVGNRADINPTLKAMFADKIPAMPVHYMADRAQSRATNAKAARARRRGRPPKDPPVDQAQS